MPQASRIVSKTIPRLTLQKLRKFIREVNWKTASSPRYRDSPHSYLIAFWYPDKDPKFDGKTPWKWFADLVRECGVYRHWHSHKYKYLAVGDEVFWIDWPALNRAQSDTLDRVETRTKTRT